MKTILIVDDERALRKALNDKLSQDNYEVVEAKDGVECIEILKEKEIDLVLLDVLMPNMGGVEVARQIDTSDELKKKPHVIVLSNQSDMKTLSEMITNNTFQYILKSDHSLENIAQIVAEQLQ